MKTCLDGRAEEEEEEEEEMSLLPPEVSVSRWKAGYKQGERCIAFSTPKC